MILVKEMSKQLQAVILVIRVSRVQLLQEFKLFEASFVPIIINRYKNNNSETVFVCHMWSLIILGMSVAGNTCTCTSIHVVHIYEKSPSIEGLRAKRGRTQRKSTKTIMEQCSSCQKKSVSQKLTRSCKIGQKPIYALFFTKALNY